MGDKRGLIVGVNVAFIAVSIFSIATRLLIRVLLIHRLGADDILIAIAFVFAVTHASLSIASTEYGEGLHAQYQSPADVPTYTRIILLLGLFYNLSQTFIKLSYLVFYLRHAITPIKEMVLYILIVVVSAFGIATSILSMTFCIPLEKLLRPSSPGSCINIRSYYLSVLPINIFLDLTIFILPIPVLWQLPLPKRQRIGLVGVFGLGIIVIIASVFRLQSNIMLLNTPDYRSDNTFTTANTLVWSSVEIHIALLVSCTAAFKALTKRFCPSFLEA